MDIVHYILGDTGSVDIALRYLDKMEKAISRLREFPNSGTVPRYSVLKRQGFKVIVVDKHLVFYKVSEENKTVIIYAIVDGRREYESLI